MNLFKQLQDEVLYLSILLEGFLTVFEYKERN